ncbi:CGNR zinc finger domain-containing protein [Streptomyces profundus]|uniref:CGNR zinc finger domain-containing protein n=1 Tax=Streptomyces profundus TaxID=2867410 RepID=UPI001D15F814|nr:CGNR zinc finger domain-containing protein [Streptomyces sp. MA3_2.13]UED84752.1 CGNR zinc finger domain-containing protein [Streptomyces sp. MA3_2.13]
MEPTPSNVTGLRLRSHRGAWYRFDPGALCLELLPTGGPGEFARWETLHTPQALDDWARACRLRPAPQLTARTPEVAAARGLRDALWGLALARVASQPLPAAELAVVNAAAAKAPLTPALTPDGTRAWAGQPTVEQLLSTVARDAVELFTGPFADRIRMCAADDCQLVYADTSRPGRRRWCAMEHCGTLNKTRTHRTRRTTPG